METNTELWNGKVEELLDVALEAQKLRAQMNRLATALDRLFANPPLHLGDLSPPGAACSKMQKVLLQRSVR